MRSPERWTGYRQEIRPRRQGESETRRSFPRWVSCAYLDGQRMWKASGKQRPRWGQRGKDDKIRSADQRSPARPGLS
jgi:hypothetical protein